MEVGWIVPGGSALGRSLSLGVSYLIAPDSLLVRWCLPDGDFIFAFGYLPTYLGSGHRQSLAWAQSVCYLLFGIPPHAARRAMAAAEAAVVVFNMALSCPGPVIVGLPFLLFPKDRRTKERENKTKERNKGKYVLRRF